MAFQRIWISPKMLCSPVLASFADSKLLNFFQDSDSMTLRINRMLCVTCYVQYVRIINTWCMRSRHGYTIIIDAGTAVFEFPRWRAFDRWSRQQWLLLNSKNIVWLAIDVDPPRQLAHHWLGHSGSADLASMIVIDTAEEATVREAYLM